MFNYFISNLKTYFIDSYNYSKGAYQFFKYPGYWMFLGLALVAALVIVVVVKKIKQH